jgi:hypothetical protein
LKDGDGDGAGEAHGFGERRARRRRAWSRSRTRAALAGWGERAGRRVQPQAERCGRIGVVIGAGVDVDVDGVEVAPSGGALLGAGGVAAFDLHRAERERARVGRPVLVQVLEHEGQLQGDLAGGKRGGEADARRERARPAVAVRRRLVHEIEDAVGLSGTPRGEARGLQHEVRASVEVGPADREDVARARRGHDGELRGQLREVSEHLVRLGGVDEGEADAIVGLGLPTTDDGCLHPRGRLGPRRKRSRSARSSRLALVTS